MKKNELKKNIMKQKTNERYLFEIFLAILLVASIAYLGHTLKERHRRISTEPTVTDLLQQQEMINYAKSEGRTINIY